MQPARRALRGGAGGSWRRGLGWLASVGAGALAAALAANVALVGSALPAAAGKGAPYMPTLRRALDAVFGRALPPLLAAGPLAARRAAAGRAATSSPLVVDLGSGDGRVVIEAARRGLRGVGYEINPLLVLFAVAWAAAERHKWRLGLGQPWPATGSARFYCRDLWGLDLSHADVVFVYGLTPIMERLSVKLLAECPHAVVVSNVFELHPTQWRKVFSGEEAFVYVARATSDEGVASAGAGAGAGKGAGAGSPAGTPAGAATPAPAPAPAPARERQHKEYTV